MKHIIRVKKLKIGNHLLAWQFARQLSRVLHGGSMIGFAGIPELCIEGQNQHILDTEYSYVDESSEYPWSKPEPLGLTIARRLKSNIILRKPNSSFSNKKAIQSHLYSRYILASNTPNLYPLRSASVGNQLLIDVNSAVCNLGYLPSRCEFQNLIPGEPSCISFAQHFIKQHSHNTLYIHIRAGDILHIKSHLYKPLPIEIIINAQKHLNASLVFIGQLYDSDYCLKLRSAFPSEEFFYSGNEAIDFEIIRAAPHILISTSTFAWLAAWISKENLKILVPNMGLFNALEAPEINLLDFNDKRFASISA